MKKFISFILTAFMLFVMFIPAFAVDSMYLIDDADLLNDDEEELLLDHIDRLRDTHGMDFIIHTTPDTYGKDIATYCDDYYDNGGYAEDGLIFVISMAERDYFTSTCGILVDSLDYYTLEELCGPVVPCLSDGEYYNAFDIYLDQIDAYLSGDWYISGNNEIIYDDGYYPDNEYFYSENDNYISSSSPISDSLLTREIILIVIAVIIAVVVTMILKSKMNTAVAKRDADDYVVSGSFRLDGSRDMFVGTHTSRRALPQNNNQNRPGGSGSGGVRVSGGGVRHGGGGGKF